MIDKILLVLLIVYFNLFSECIRFALTPLFSPDDPTQPGPNILFLEVLPEFASKLLKPDKKAMYINMHMNKKLFTNIRLFMFIF